MDTVKPRIFKDRLATTDEMGNRVRVIPARVWGRFTRAKSVVHTFLVGFFLVLPWIKIGGSPALMLDVPHRRFYLAGHLFLPQDVPGIFFIIASFVVALLFFSALLGRVWCGWACPQTVFIEGFFRRVERWIEGDHLKQRELDRMPWNTKKITLRSLKWLAFLAGSLVLTHSFLAYFVGGENVLKMMTHSPAENPGSFAVVMVSTAVILFDFGWFREQFCLIACPYGRFQSAMMDEQSITIAYDAKRGEPRKGSEKVAGANSFGDCINCLKCVKVCPTGIDIRNGFQMECIACTACVDTCDEVMDKIGKPRGLIRYTSEAELAGGKQQLLRPRIIIYGLLFVFMLGGLTYRIATRESYQTEILRAVDMPFQVVKSGDGKDEVINHFKVNWYNMSAENSKVGLRLSRTLTDEGFVLIQTNPEFDIKIGGRVNHQFFLKFPRTAAPGGSRSVQIESFWVVNQVEKVFPVEVNIVGPDGSL